MTFDREISHYVIKKCVLAHKGHIINKSSISGHARVESNLSKYEKNQLAKFGRMGSTTQNAKNGFIRLFMNRTNDSSLIYRVIKKRRTLHLGDSSDCMMILMDLGNYHKSKEGVLR